MKPGKPLVIHSVWAGLSSRPALAALPLWLCIAAFCVPAAGQSSPPAAQSADDLASKSLEELMDIKVTSASKKEEKMFKTAAAIYVITSEDIRRSGMTRIPDLLRMVPGVDVARIDGVGWAISVRGFDRRFTSKLLVLIDGRSVYSHDTSGVYWEALDMPLELIDRIEVIRGPGGALWGANAVNGVINIITKRAVDTQGGMITSVTGSEDRVGSAVYGGRIGDDAYYRVYGKYLNSTGLVDASGQPTHDGMDSGHGGMRLDWQASDSDSLTVLGELYDMADSEKLTFVSSLQNPLAPLTNDVAHYSGGNLVGRWDHIFSDSSDMSLQFYFDSFNDGIPVESAHDKTYDFEFQHHFAWGDRQDIIWGLGYRLIGDHFGQTPFGPVQFYPDARDSQIFSAFFQDEITLVEDRLRLTVGSRLEHDDFAGFQGEPNARLLWTPSARQTVWAAVSRAVRTPSRGEEDIDEDFEALPGPDGLPVVVTVFGNPGYKSEDLLAYETGYRAEVTNKVSLDIAAFYNVYTNLQTDTLGTPYLALYPVPRIVQPITFGNQMDGHTYGVEPSVNWAVTKFWKLSGSYSFLHMVLNNKSGNLLGDNAGDSPAREFQVRSYMNLPRSFRFDVAAYHVSNLPAESVPAYTRLDAAIGWHPTESMEFSFGGQNLLSPRHIESMADDASAIPTEVKRTAYGKITWRF